MSGRKAILILTVVFGIQGGQAKEEPLLRAPPQFEDGKTRLVVTFTTKDDPKRSFNGACKLYNNTAKATLLGELKDFTSDPLRIVVEADPCEVITDLFITCSIITVGELSSLHFNYDDLPPRCSSSPNKKKPFLDRSTILALSIGLPGGLTAASISLCLLAVCVKRCRRRVEEDGGMGDYAGDLNEDYGVYYSAGERVEIESEARDYNPDYEATGEQGDTAPR